MPSSFFGKQLLALRETLGKSKYQAVKESGIDKALYKRVENGDRLPTDEVLQKLAPVVGLSFPALKRMAVDDSLGALDIAVLLDWCQQEVNDRQRRASVDFWQRLAPLDRDLQLGRLFKSLGKDVVVFSEPMTVSGFKVTGGGETLFVCTGYQPDDLKTWTLENPIHVAREASGAEEVWIFGQPVADLSVVKECRLIFKTSEDLAEMARKVSAFRKVATEQ